MTNNQNFYSNFTFHRDNYNMPPPNFMVPPPPPPSQRQIQSDEELVKSFEQKLPVVAKKRHKVKISEVCSKVRNIVCLTKHLKDKQEYLENNIDNLSKHVWVSNMEEVRTKIDFVKSLMADIQTSQMDCVVKALSKRSAKRARLRRIKLEKRIIKQEKIREWGEKSRVIDENLQKIKANIDKLKKEEESKLQADIILRDVLRKKLDSKKTIKKLDALVKLRRARENTAKGQGIVVSESDTKSFHGNIEKIKSLWQEKLHIYEKEESELQSQLDHDLKNQRSTVDRELVMKSNLGLWNAYLFGTDQLPQFDFKNDSIGFVNNRRQWDNFISDYGSALPIGWVLPATS